MTSSDSTASNRSASAAAQDNARASANVFLSIIVPVKDEEPNMVPLLDEIEAALAQIHKPYEVLMVDDGSRDGTLERLREAQSKRPWLRIIQFRRNCGQTAALDAGIRAARGQWLAFLDGDRQNDPADIPAMLDEAQKGFDMVAGWRRERQDTAVRRLSSRIANKVRDSILHDNIRDVGCTLKIVRRSCLDRIKLFTGLHRFLPALMLNEGFKVTQTPVNHRPRAAGRSKYGIGNRLFRSLHDLFAVHWMKKRSLRYEIEKEW